MATAETHQTIHADHRHWQSEISSWREDITAWQKEQERLTAQLEEALNAQTEALNKHAEAIGRHEEKILNHEHLIAECEKSAQDASIIEEGFCEEHREQATKQQHDRDAHERIKKHHHQAMARIQLVVDALNSPL